MFLRKKMKYDIEVTAIHDLTPLVRRVTFRGELFGGDLECQPAQWLKLFLPNGGNPASRAYSIRRHDRQASSVDIDFVRHGHGPAGRWAEQARVGDWIGCSALRGGFQPQEEAEWLLLAADETGTAGDEPSWHGYSRKFCCGAMRHSGFKDSGLASPIQVPPIRNALKFKLQCNIEQQSHLHLQPVRIGCLLPRACRRGRACP